LITLYVFLLIRLGIFWVFTHLFRLLHHIYSSFDESLRLITTNMILAFLSIYLYLFFLIGIVIFGFSRISSDFYITSTRVLMNLYDLFQLIWCWHYFTFHFTHSYSLDLVFLVFHASLQTFTSHLLEFWWIFTINYN